MRRFIINILFFSVGLWLLALIVDVCVSYRFANTEAWDNQVWSKMIRSEMDNDLLILGSSRAFVQYDPRIIDSTLHTNCYNLGRDGKRIDIQYLAYQIYKKYGNTPPKTIVLDFFDASLALSDPYNSAFFFPFLWEKDIWKCIHNTQHMKSYWRYVPLIRYYSQWGFVKKNMHSEYPIHKGYYSFEKTWDPTDFNNVEKIEFFAEDTAIAILDNFLNECVHDSINVILVHSPIYYMYWEKFPDSASMWELYRSFSAKYNIPILDYTTSEICKDTNYFYNARHLNRKGAEIFTRQLAHDLDSLGYSNKVR